MLLFTGTGSLMPVAPVLTRNSSVGWPCTLGAVMLKVKWTRAPLAKLPAAVHTVTDLGSALPKGVPTITQRARDAGIQTALFTDVPTSFRPYGFYRSMTRFVSISPAEGESRSALLEAASFVTTTLEREPTARIFLVVHAEGGHPPERLPCDGLKFSRWRCS